MSRIDEALGFFCNLMLFLHTALQASTNPNFILLLPKYPEALNMNAGRQH